MKKIFSFIKVKNFIVVFIVFICVIGLLFFPKEAGKGIKDGLKTLYETIVPSLFPFMVLSSYIASSPQITRLVSKLEVLSKKLFKLPPCGLSSLILGFLGGYPTGAKTACEFYENGMLSESEIKRLFCFCVNPSVAFSVTAVGTFMYNNTKLGVIFYVSAILSSLTIGLLLRFTEKNETTPISVRNKNLSTENAFISSVSKGNSAMISVCGWVLIFSSIGSILSSLKLNSKTSLFLTCILEVTTGCKEGVLNNIPVFLVSALLSFGGLAVIFQVSPYLEKCNISLKDFLCWRIINGALSGLYCLIICKIFPQSIISSVNINFLNTTMTLNHSILAGIVCVLMCFVFIFEVDNKRKIC